MKRSSSSEFASESKRFEASYPPPSPFQQQMQKQQQQMQQQQQIQAQQQLQVQQQMQAQQQQQFQAQQQQYQQQMQAAQQQQQQQFYNQAAYYPMNSVNYTPYVPTQSPVMYNSSPSWNFMSSPPPFFPSSPAPAASTSQPPLPPPELKPEKPPLPKEPEPGNSAQSTSDSAALQGAKIPPGGFNGIGRPRGPGPMSGHRMRGGMNGGFNGFNPGMGMRGLVGGRPNGMHNNMRGRGRRNHHFFPQMPSPQLVVPPMDLQRIGEIPDFARLIEEDQPAGPEKLTIFLNNTDNGRVQVNKKAKRKPMSTRYTRTKMWVREEAEAAIALEKEFNRMQKRPMLILKFPDPDLNKFIVKKYSPLIDSVHFQQPSTPRYCFVQLKEDADVDKVISTIRQIPFGTGTITCELKHQLLDDQPVTPEEIDPYTLYIGNLPTHISVRVVKQYFPNAQRIDIGYAQRMRYTRYAFIRYNTVAEAMASYKRTVNALLDSRSLIVRFRRQKGNIGLPGETKLSAPRRDGKEILPDKEPKVLEHDAEGHEMETLPEEMDSEHIEEDADDEEEEDDGTNAEKAKETPKEIVVKPFAAINPKPSTEVTPSTSAADVRPSSEAPPKDSRKSNVSTKSPPPDPESFGGYPNEYPDCPSDSDSDIAQAVLRSGKPVLEETDTKTSVLAEATALMRKNKTMALRQKLIESDMLSLPNLPPPKPGDIKIEETDEDDSSDDGINMLGTRVKEEPTDDPPIRDAMAPATLDDMYLDDYEYDDLDCEPEEEDDDWEPPQFTPKSGSDWEAIRRNELNTKEDKPDLDVLSNIHHLLPSSSIAPIPADLEPKAEVEDDSDKPKKPDPEPLTETEELKQMFAQLNSDPECDDDDTFFG